MDKLKELITSILTYIGGSFFRLFTVIILAILGFGGWVAYSEKDAFMVSYRAQQALPRMNGNYEKAANFILKNTDATLIAIFDVNTLLNSRKLVYLMTRDGRDKDYDGTEVGLLTKNHSNNEDVIGLMSGKLPCSPYATPQSYLGFVYKENKVEYMCRISVPAEPGLFIGQISVGWKEVKEDPTPEQTVLLIASSLLYSKK
ncbi:hypothetical protein UFOVP961_10 [uncultured Caudovirales phage]|uniref:Uncharacterized protein n=1 Tax=uncultured Caudovirales phage TaxID=2100421 RepID=A0A6J5PUQ8_9CAUD|nr:hypothetical protein UFOVP961_10 [uncultured Caudovirales phage]CAB4185480.1 hypothetical protein UFOVP1123_80 [uncultured Caudovirales phage]CAB4193381.1 hypothetical protein UFOVP1239_70 [uncultured Caudovirales phage]CAB4216117.1 hypothetical protein UFOVP1484_84 [uncultured Caudovirales phage]CAB5230753.1 hypothetical protein UFOVP1577_90 [uncultured Caudovirales phage]